ncbi:serine protease [Acholeplasma sp. OttesenSCG-928-E16]|nr:serine protease [Acholeplasma sp. OttesenSCG-928-E16]
MFVAAAKKVEDAMYGIKCQNRKTGSMCFGTGFAFNERYILTCAHLVFDKNDISLQMHDSFYAILDKNLGDLFFECRLVALDDQLDLAVLEIISDEDYNYDYLSLSKYNPKIGEEHGSYGYPLCEMDQDTGVINYPKRFKAHYISRFNSIFDMEIDTVIVSGSSGSPVFNSYGIISGIIFGYNEGTEVKKFQSGGVKTTEAIQVFLSHYGIPYTIV